MYTWWIQAKFSRDFNLVFIPLQSYERTSALQHVNTLLSGSMQCLLAIHSGHPRSMIAWSLPNSSLRPAANSATKINSWQAVLAQGKAWHGSMSSKHVRRWEAESNCPFPGWELLDESHHFYTLRICRFARLHSTQLSLGGQRDAGETAVCCICRQLCQVSAAASHCRVDKDRVQHLFSTKNAQLPAGTQSSACAFSHFFFFFALKSGNGSSANHPGIYTFTCQGAPAALQQQ